MLKQALKRVMNKEVLTEEECYNVMLEILQGKATDAQISSFISLLTFRGVEVDELIGLTRAMRELATPVKLNLNTPVIDTCGTGGDGAKTFNVSTAGAIVAASAGVPVAKHGNRAASSLSGSADVLEVLGLPVEIEPSAIVKAIERFNMCFMFAPLYHQAMKYAAGPRKEIGFHTVFNLLGPLTNPAGTRHQVIGIYDHHYSEKMAETMRRLGAEHVLIVHGEDGLDEFSVSAPSLVTELKDGQLKNYRISPEDVGLHRHSLSDVQVNTPAESAAKILAVLRGEDTEAAHDIVCFNAGAALYVGQKADSLVEGVQLARELIRSGQAYRHYQNMVDNSEVLRYA
jgi:anthranilate phosphoribosyltransferase